MFLDIKVTGKLIGHVSGLTCVKWSNESENKLVSTSFDNTVRVWNTEKLECISIYRFSDRLFSAIFYPTNDNFILCSGKSETLKMFDSTKYFHDEKCTSMFNYNLLYLYVINYFNIFIH